MSPRKRKSSEMESDESTNHSGSRGHPAETSAPHGLDESQSQASKAAESVHEDDICPVCHLLIYRPVTTVCSHTLCEWCMQQWADVSVTTELRPTAIGIDQDGSTGLDPSDLEARCPMCRTLTRATINRDMVDSLQARYPATYEARRAEHVEAEANDATIILYVGNTHQHVAPNEHKPNNMHEWKFFVRISRTDLIEEVQVHLHPTFRTSRVILQHPIGNSYEVRRLGWGYFIVKADVILKAGYSWLSVDAQDSPDGQKDGMLEFRWMLDFRGDGSQARCRVKVKKEKQGQEREDERQRDQVRRLWMQQRERDPDYHEP